MAMDLVSVDPDSPVAPFEQIRVQIADLVERGVLRPETRLPPVRRLAQQLGLAPNTVARAYRELEEAGMVETDGRRGTSVAGTPTPERARAGQLAGRYLDEVTGLGLSPTEAVAMVRRAAEERSAAAFG